VYAGTITSRRGLIDRIAISATIKHAVPEHSSCACAIFAGRNAARLPHGHQSDQRIGKPAVGGTSPQRSSLAIEILAQSKANDARDNGDTAEPL
jgi:hypothetical protein